MTAPSKPTRRGVLRLAAGSSFLPLVGASCASSRATDGLRKPLRVEFLPMDAPGLDAPEHMATTHVTSGLRVAFDDGTQVEAALDYRTLFRTGSLLPDGAGGQVLAGGYSDIEGRPILDRSVPGDERPFFSDCPDGMSLLEVPGARVDGVTGNTVFAVVQFEYTTWDQSLEKQYGALPSPIAVVTLDQDPDTGALRVVQYHDVDTSSVQGLWITCGASLSPWNTHLSSEEYAPDAFDLPDYFARFSQNLYGDPERANSYHYGHLPEVTVNPDGTGSIAKHYCLGRISHELVQVMPDERTVLMGDDWSNGGLFLFLADEPRDLSAGTLYVAQCFSGPADPNTFLLEWIELGHATSDEIQALVDGGIRPENIFDQRTEDPQDPSFTRIPYAGKTRWVRLREGMELAAAFLETHRYAALKGGSLGFTKMEGTTVDPESRKAYSAIAGVGTPMRDGSGHIRSTLDAHGAVFELDLAPPMPDCSGGDMRSEWIPWRMAPVPALTSRSLPTPDALGNAADPERVASPDNLKYSSALRTLFVGEDSGGHVNNFLWAYQTDTGQLARILSCPTGAESTGLHAVDDLNGWTYVATNFQHAGDWRDAHNTVRPSVEPLITKQPNGRFGAAVGYLVARLDD